jgi:DNA-binding MarR family transcriptional regulator
MSRSPAQLFRELARIHVRAQRLAVARRGASATRCTILTELGRAGTVSLAELATRIRLDKGWVSRAVDQLVLDGGVLRVADPTDRRAVVLTMTAKGRRMHRELEEILDGQIEAVFSGLSEAERERVASALDILLEAYTAHVSMDDQPVVPAPKGSPRSRRSRAPSRSR